MQRPRYVVGIDLGTTNTVVAFAAIPSGRKAPTGSHEIAIFDVAQWVSMRDQESRPMLASCLYAPLPGEVAGDPDWIVGHAARLRGTEIAGRTVTSAKSWLCHAAVDRWAPILPWGGNLHDDAPRISPVDACTRILQHVRDAWNRAMPEAPLDAQHLVVTVPASFDDAARTLTLAAAERAGLRPVLAEEPTAAFYAWLGVNAPVQDARRETNRDEASEWDWLESRASEDSEGAERSGASDSAARSERTVLVCDVGGGTTDFSLMGVRAASGKEATRSRSRSRSSAKGSANGISETPRVRRIAVGRHILLGGDNMDLALAHLAERQMAAEGASPLGPTQFAQLVLECRRAKEMLLSDSYKTVHSARVSVLGSGAGMMRAMQSTTLARGDVERVVIDGFFPLVRESSAAPAPRSAVTLFGLPYERNPAITEHMHAFLRRHAAEVPGGVPDAVLVTGGVFHSARVREAVARALSVPGKKVARVLEGDDPDVAVARGAVLFGLAQHGVGLRVEAGAARGYYIALGAADGRSESHKSAVCMLPRHAPEGRVFDTEQTFELVTGRNVRFELYASDSASDEAGAVVALRDDVFDLLPPVVARFVPLAGKVHATVPVRVGAELLATGQLEVRCTELVSGRVHRLEFDLRHAQAPDALVAPGTADEASSAAPKEIKNVFDRVRTATDAQLAGALRVLEHVFGKKAHATERDVKDVVRDVEKIVGERTQWSLATSRAVVDALLQHPGSRRRSAAHERAFWLLVGFGLRPGFGDLGDDERIARVWPLFDGRLAFVDEARGWQQFFIAWRRLSGGLNEDAQCIVREAWDGLVAPADANVKKPKRLPLALDEVVPTLAALERVPAPRRIALGEWLFEKTWVSDDSRVWAALGRIGARVPAYASAHYVIAPSVVEVWLEKLLRKDWSKLAVAVATSVYFARVTGDRSRDISPRLRADVAKRLAAVNAKPEDVQAVTEFVPMDERTRAAMFGEDLPYGLRLRAEWT